MYQFKRAIVLPLFLKRRITLKKLAREAGVSDLTIKKALDGQFITAAVVDKIACALGASPLDILVERRVKNPEFER